MSFIEDIRNGKVKNPSLIKNWISESVLESKGFSTYAKFLKLFDVVITDDPDSPSAYVQPFAGIIGLHRERAFKSEDYLSMMIRHEILHVMLDHVKREVRYLAKEMGYDPDHLTKRQFYEVLGKQRDGTTIGYTQYGSANIGNVAGDIHLSNNYTLKDSEISNSIGGLLIDDHPGFEGKTFEEILRAIKEEDSLLKRRQHKIINGTFDVDGNFVETSREDAYFDSITLPVEDIWKVGLPTFDDMLEIKLTNSKGHKFWLKKNPTEEFPSYFDESIEVYAKDDDDVRDMKATAIPVLMCRNLVHFTNIQKAGYFNIGQSKFILLDQFRAIPEIIPKSLENIPWDRDYTTTYKGSDIEKALNDYLKQLKENNS